MLRAGPQHLQDARERAAPRGWRAAPRSCPGSRPRSRSARPSPRRRPRARGTTTGLSCRASVGRSRRRRAARRPSSLPAGVEEALDELDLLRRSGACRSAAVAIAVALLDDARWPSAGARAARSSCCSKASRSLSLRSRRPRRAAGSSGGLCGIMTTDGVSKPSTSSPASSLIEGLSGPRSRRQPRARRKPAAALEQRLRHGRVGGRLEEAEEAGAVPVDPLVGRSRGSPRSRPVTRPSQRARNSSRTAWPKNGLREASSCARTSRRSGGVKQGSRRWSSYGRATKASRSRRPATGTISTLPMWPGPLYTRARRWKPPAVLLQSSGISRGVRPGAAGAARAWSIKETGRFRARCS